MKKTTDHIFKTGDRVFAKMKGYSYWPSRIELLPDEVNNKDKYKVYFFGTYECALVNKKQILLYNEETKLKHGKEKRIKCFNKALKEIENVNVYETIDEYEVVAAKEQKVQAKNSFKNKTELNKVIVEDNRNNSNELLAQTSGTENKAKRATKNKRSLSTNTDRSSRSKRQKNENNVENVIKESVQEELEIMKREAKELVENDSQSSSINPSPKKHMNVSMFFKKQQFERKNLNSSVLTEDSAKENTENIEHESIETPKLKSPDQFQEISRLSSINLSPKESLHEYDVLFQKDQNENIHIETETYHTPETKLDTDSNSNMSKTHSFIKRTFSEMNENTESKLLSDSFNDFENKKRTPFIEIENNVSINYSPIKEVIILPDLYCL